LKITATVFPLMEFAQAVAGDQAEVRMFIPSGADIHTWQPKPGDIANLASSDCFISIGLHLEPWTGEILKALPPSRLTTLEAGRSFQMDRHGEHFEEKASGHSHQDPHVWLDFSFDMTIIEQIVDMLTRLRPSLASVFQRNGEVYKAELASLDGAYKKTLENCSKKPVLYSGHAAFNALASRYGLRFVPLYGLSPDAEPTPARLVEVIDLARKSQVRTVFFEPSVPSSKRLASTIAREVGGTERPLYPGHNLSSDDLKAGKTFLSLMKENLKNLKEGLCGNGK
jgi:zinc transport system substrate-binding protein